MITSLHEGDAPPLPIAQVGVVHLEEGLAPDLLLKTRGLKGYLPLVQRDGPMVAIPANLVDHEQWPRVRCEACLQIGDVSKNQRGGRNPEVSAAFRERLAPVQDVVDV